MAKGNNLMTSGLLLSVLQRQWKIASVWKMGETLNNGEVPKKLYIRKYY